MAHLASISVTTYNRWALSKVAIYSILANTPRNKYELIVVDNSSTDETQDELYEMKQKGLIDKLFINNWNKYLGVATNQCFDLAHPEARWLINFSNDHYCMPGWFEHLMDIAEPLELDFVYTVLRPGICNADQRKIIPVGMGQGLLPHPEVQIGGGIAIRHQVVMKHNIRWVEKWNGVVMGSIYSVFHQEATRLGLRWVEQYKPCVLTQNCEFNNPAYANYYNSFFDGRGTRDRLERLRQRGGYLTKEQADEYYRESGYSYTAGAEANARELEKICRERTDLF